MKRPLTLALAALLALGSTAALAESTVSEQRAALKRAFASVNEDRPAVAQDRAPVPLFGLQIDGIAARDTWQDGGTRRHNFGRRHGPAGR